MEFSNAARTGRTSEYNGALGTDLRHVAHHGLHSCSGLDASTPGTASSVCAVQASIARTECVGVDSLGRCWGTTTYEMRVPAAYIGRDVFSEGDQFGLGIGAVDADTIDTDSYGNGWSGWAPYAIFYGKNAAHCGLVTMGAVDELSNASATDVLAQLKGPSRAAWRDQHPQGGCDYAYFAEPLSFEDAEAACVRAGGGHLASLHSSADWRTIQQIVPDGQRPFVGFRVRDTMPGTMQLAAPACGWTDGDCNQTLPYICGYPCGDDVSRLAREGKVDTLPRMESRLHLQRQQLTLRHMMVSSTTQAFGGGGTELGGSIQCEFSQLTLTSVEFVDNEQAGFGSGVLFVDHSNVDIIFSSFRSNKIMGMGAGVIYAMSSNVSVANTVISDNDASPVMGMSAESSMRRQASTVNDGTHKRQLQLVDITTASVIVATDSAVSIADSQLQGNTGAPLMRAHASEVSVAQVIFEQNAGGTVIIAADSTDLQVIGAAFTKNRFDNIVPAGLVPRAAVSILTGSIASMSSASFVANTGDAAGAIFVSGATTAVTLLTVQFLGNTFLKPRGAISGAIFIEGGAHLAATRCKFADNVANSEHAAGAVFSRDSIVTFSESNFTGNAGHGALSGAGAMYTETSSVEVFGCSVEHNIAVGGIGEHRPLFAEAVWIFSPTHVQLKDTKFKPILDGSKTVSISPGSLSGILQGGCEQHPCAQGASKIPICHSLFTGSMGTLNRALFCPGFRPGVQLRKLFGQLPRLPRPDGWKERHSLLHVSDRNGTERGCRQLPKVHREQRLHVRGLPGVHSRPRVKCRSLALRNVWRAPKRNRQQEF